MADTGVSSIDFVYDGRNYTAYINGNWQLCIDDVYGSRVQSSDAEDVYEYADNNLWTILTKLAV